MAKGKAKTDSKVESASGGLVFEHFESVFNTALGH